MDVYASMHACMQGWVHHRGQECCGGGGGGGLCGGVRELSVECWR